MGLPGGMGCVLGEVTKLYCYVDETGQDTEGTLFIVSVVITDRERDKYQRVCEAIEQGTGKRGAKWIKTSYERRLDYVQRVLESPLFVGKLNFAVYRDIKAYQGPVVQAIAWALEGASEGEYQATVLIDGLPRKLERAVSRQLRKEGVRVKKVRGIKDESDSLIRLADALCGLVRAAIEGQPAMVNLLNQGVARGVLRDLTRQKKTPMVRGNALSLAWQEHPPIRAVFGTHI